MDYSHLGRILAKFYTPAVSNPPVVLTERLRKEAGSISMMKMSQPHYTRIIGLTLTALLLGGSGVILATGTSTDPTGGAVPGTSIALPQTDGPSVEAEPQPVAPIASPSTDNSDLSSSTNPSPLKSEASIAQAFSASEAYGTHSGIIAIPPGTLLTPQQRPVGDLGRSVESLRRLDLSGARRELIAFNSQDLSREDKIRSVFLRGALEMAEGAYDRAAESYASIQNGIPGLRVEIAAREGRARVKAGDFKLGGDRLSAAAKAAPEGDIARELWLEAAGAYTQARWFKSATTILDTLKEDEDRKTPSDDAISLAEATLLLKRGHLSDAREAFQTLQGDAEDCAIVGHAGDALQELTTSGFKDAPGPLSQELARVGRLIACQDYEAAEARLTVVAEVTPESALEDAWINLWYRSWNLEQVNSYVETRLKGPLNDGDRRRLLRWLARSAWREGAAERAADLRADAAALKDKPLDKDDMYHLGVLYTEAHAFDKAAPLLESALSARLTKRKRVEAKWYQAWGSLMEGDFVLARERLLTFHDDYPDQLRGIAALYWLARLDIIEGDGESALERLETLKAEEPDSFYTFLAQTMRLEEAAAVAKKAPITEGSPEVPSLVETQPDVRVPALLTPASLTLSEFAPTQRMRPRVPGPGETPLLDIPSPLRRERPRDVQALEDAGITHLEGLTRVYGSTIPELDIALSLAKAGFRDDANPWLEQAYYRGRKSKDSKERRFSKERESLYYSFWLVGNPLLCQRLDPTGWPFPKLNLDEPDSTAPWMRRYARVYAHEVSHAHYSWGVDPSLIYGIMRTESLFGARQISQVGARGLMQIMPRTGQRIAGLLEEPFELEDLYDPGTNVWYGAWYLSQLLERFDGQLPLAIAAYNAGPIYVSNWIHRSGEVPVDVFIEEIPITQTRKYVKKVLRAMAIYRGLYAGSPQLPLNRMLSPDDRGGVNF